jgi:hypothetical protein
MGTVRSDDYNPDDEVVEDEMEGYMVMPEDALCYIPCGEEPMGCANCPERGRTEVHDKGYYSDRLRFLEDIGIDMDDPRFDDVWSEM